MMKKFEDKFVLANGVEIPCIGYGTWQTPSGEVTRNGVLDALRAGYRHIDTAFCYGNEADVGEAIRLSGVPREEIFVTTKHWVTERGYEKTIQAIEGSLEALGLDYVDLYLIHWPCVESVSPDWEEINASTWKGFEEMYRKGKIRALGVSNFQAKHLDSLFKYAEIPPVVNQIEFHPGYTQMETVKYSQEKGMVVEGWSPLGCGAVLQDETLKAIAAKYGKSTAQLCVRFALQNDVLPMPKSTSAAHIAANTEVFDFEISEEDMKTIFDMPLLGFSGFLPEEAPADALVASMAEE